MLALIDRYLSECDAGHAVFVAAINASVDLSHLIELRSSPSSLAKMEVAMELLMRAAHAQRASALLKLAGVISKLDACLTALQEAAPQHELRILVERDLNLRKSMTADITAAAIRPFSTLVLYQDVWRLSPHLTDARFLQLRTTLK